MKAEFQPATEIERAIVAGNTNAVIEAFARLTPKERAAQRPGVMRALKAMGAAYFALVEKAEGIWEGPVTREQRRAGGAAIVFCGTAKDIAENLGEVEDLIAIAREGRPPGLANLGEALLDHSLFSIHRVQRLIAEGLIDRPSGDRYAIALMGLNGRHIRDLTLKDYWNADPGLKDSLLRIMEVEGTSDFNLAAIDTYTPPDRRWSRILGDLAAEGVYPRALLLDKTLSALERDWPQFRAGWFSRFHQQLAPTISELRPLRSRYVALTASRIPPTVTLALDALKQLDADEPFTAYEWSEALLPVMSSSVKAQVVGALKQMDRVVKRDPSSSALFGGVAAPGLSHPAPDVQKAVLDRLQRWGAGIELREALASYLPGIAAMNRPVLQALVGQSDAPELAAPRLELANGESMRVARAAPLSPLDPSCRVAEIHDTDELIDRLAYVFENADDADEFERVLAALVRHGPVSAQLRPRFAPVLKRSVKMVKPLPRELARMLRFLFDGAQLAPSSWRDDSRGHTSRGELFLVSRVDSLMHAAGGALRLTPLAAPTHRLGFIDPAECVARLAQYARARVEPSLLESVQALLRLAPIASAAVSEQASALPGWPVVRALRYALGDDVEPRGPEPLFAAAARIRHPGSDDPRLLATRGDRGPDTARLARYEWHVTAEKGGDHTFRYLSVHTSIPAGDTPIEYLAAARPPRSAAGAGRYHRRSMFAGPAPGLVAWSATVLPSNLDAHFAEGADIIGNNLDWWEAQWWTAAYLKTLLGATGPFTEMAALLLGLGLCAREPGHVAISVDAYVQAHRQGRCSAAILGPVIRRLLASEFVLASRLAKSLRAVLRIEPALAGEVFDLLAETISANPAAPPKDTAKLLELLQETMLTSGRSLPATAHSDLAAMQIGGQGLRIRKALLGSGRI